MKIICGIIKEEKIAKNTWDNENTENISLICHKENLTKLTITYETREYTWNNENSSF